MKILVVKRTDCILPSLFQKEKQFTVMGKAGTFLRDLPFQWKEREPMETDDSFKQLIPYVVVTREVDGVKQYLTYARAKGSGEERLLGNRSIGFGGHIDYNELDEAGLKANLLSNPMMWSVITADKELEEEINLQHNDCVHREIIGLINDDSTDVGSVHLGVVMRLKVKDGWEPTQREEGVADLCWMTADELYLNKYEVWSQLIIDHINPDAQADEPVATTAPPEMEMHTAEFAAVSVPALDMTPEESIAHYARVSNPTNQMNHASAPALIKYLVVNSHWSPFDMVTLTMKVRTTRSIMAQILRHWSFRFQEFSQRYASVSAFDFSKVEARTKPVEGSNRQGSGEVSEVATIAMQEMCHERSQQYLNMVEDEVFAGHVIAPECARDILPLATPTTGYMTGSVRSWMTYFWQRLCPHAQKEHREVAWAMFEIFEQQFPMIADLVLNHKPQVIQCEWASERPAKPQLELPITE